MIFHTRRASASFIKPNIFICQAQIVIELNSFLESEFDSKLVRTLGSHRLWLWTYVRPTECIYIYSIHIIHIHAYAVVYGYCAKLTIHRIDISRTLSSRRTQKPLFEFSPTEIWFVYLYFKHFCFPDFLPHHGQSEMWSEYFVHLCLVMAPRTVCHNFTFISNYRMIMFRKWSRSRSRSLLGILQNAAVYFWEKVRVLR